MTRRRLVLIAKIALAAAILALLSRYVNIADIAARLRGASLGYLLAALALLTLQVVCASLRWLTILALAGCRIGTCRAIGSFAAGSLVNAALPGGVVGDAMRIWVTARDGAGVGETTYSVILDRLFALLGLGLLAALGTLLSLAIGARSDELLMKTSLAIGAASIAGLIALVAIAPLIGRFVAKAPRLLGHVKNLSAMAGAIRDPSRGLPILAITLFANAMLVATIALLARGLGARLDPIDALIGAPLALEIAAVPATPGGWGLREGAMAVILARFGVDSGAAIAISVMFGLFSILANLPAAAIWFAWMQLTPSPRLR
jgi:uncharacterized protein (TIRG00374 family)